MYTIHTYNFFQLLKKLPKKLILLGFFAVIMCQNSYADHVEGGGIDMRALSNTPGKYRITLRMYCDMFDFPAEEYDKAKRITS
jgi:hypothetical protein